MADTPGITRQLFRLFGPYWLAGGARVRWAAVWFLLLTMAQVALSVWGNFWNRELFDALGQRSVSGVLLQVGMFALILLVSMAVTAGHLMVKRWLQLDWRRWLTERLVRKWLKQGRHVRLQFLPGEHDNPDARIAEDIRIATEVAVAMTHTLLFSLMTLALFIGILWEVSGTLTVPGLAVEVPGYMVPLAFAYAGLGTGLGWWIGRSMVRSSDALQTAEASFRFGLARVRAHGEEITLARGEDHEQADTRVRFASVARDWDRQSFAILGIVSFSTAYGALLPIFPILIAAPQYIAGAMTLGMLMQAAGAFQRVTSALSWPVDNLGELARLRASAARVLSLYADLDALKAGPAGAIRVESGPADALEIDALTVRDPSGRKLLEGFSARLEAGESVLIGGDPVATIALYKALAGLWTQGSGAIRLPAGARVGLLAHRPYLPEGPLREALCYPDPPPADDTALLAALAQVGAGDLAGRLAESADWSEVLPLRERQRLGLARVLLQRPDWLVMEESTDAFDAAEEAGLLRQLADALPATTRVTIGFHPALAALHQRALVVRQAIEPGAPLLTPAAQS